MPVCAVPPLWAVHIADSVLTPPWLVGGFLAAWLLLTLGAWRVHEDEIARVALLTAAFFLGSLLHVPLGPTSVHLLLNGLVGVLLGLRAALAIPVGLFLQAALIGHGGFTTLGVNSCVLILPALGAGWLFAAVRRIPWVRRPWFRAGLVSVCTGVWILSLTYSIALLVTNRLSAQSTLDTSWANHVTTHPITLTTTVILAGLAAWVERRLEHAPEFPLGLLVGETAVLGTLLLNAGVLLAGGQEDWQTLVLLTVVAHLPVAVVEGVILGFTVGFLARVKPELLSSVPDFSVSRD